MRVGVETERNKFVPKKFVAKLFCGEKFLSKKNSPRFLGGYLLSVRRLLLPFYLSQYLDRLLLLFLFVLSFVLEG